MRRNGGITFLPLVAEELQNEFSAAQQGSLKNTHFAEESADGSRFVKEQAAHDVKQEKHSQNGERETTPVRREE